MSTPAIPTMSTPDPMRLALAIGFWVRTQINEALMAYHEDGISGSTPPTKYDITRLAIDIAEQLGLPAPGWKSSSASDLVDTDDDGDEMFAEAQTDL